MWLRCAPSTQLPFLCPCVGGLRKAKLPVLWTVPWLATLWRRRGYKTIVAFSGKELFGKRNLFATDLFAIGLLAKMPVCQKACLPNDLFAKRPAC